MLILCRLWALAGRGHVLFICLMSGTKITITFSPSTQALRSFCYSYSCFHVYSLCENDLCTTGSFDIVKMEMLLRMIFWWWDPQILPGWETGAFLGPLLTYLQVSSPLSHRLLPHRCPFHSKRSGLLIWYDTLYCCSHIHIWNVFVVLSPLIPMLLQRSI